MPITMTMMMLIGLVGSTNGSGSSALDAHIIKMYFNLNEFHLKCAKSPMTNMNMMTLLVATKKLGGFLVVVRFRVGCVGDSNARQGRAGVALFGLACTANRAILLYQPLYSKQNCTSV